MATRLYFHDASYTGSGTWPSGEQSAATASSGSPVDAATRRAMNTTLGAAQTTVIYTTAASTARQTPHLRTFISEPLASAQTVGSGSIVLNTALFESNLNVNVYASCNVYVWRPSTGTKVGTILDAVGTSLLFGQEPTSASVQQVSHGSRITPSVSAAAGDVIICEVWLDLTQGMGTSYNARFYYDGTTANTTANATVSNHASFIEFTENLVFAGGTVFGTATGTTATSAPGSVGVTRSDSLTGSDATGAVGSLGAVVEQAAQLTGTQAAGSTGSVGVFFDFSRELTGTQAAGSAGSASGSTAKALTGASASGQLGSITEALEKALTGTQATGAVGSVGEINAQPLTGISAPGQAGSVGEERAQLLSGVAATAEEGLVGGQGPVVDTIELAGAELLTFDVAYEEYYTPDREVALFGVGATAAVGLVDSLRTRAISGVQITGATGSVGEINAQVQTGVTSTGAVGSVAVAPRVLALTGVQASGVVGSVDNALAAGLSGAQAAVSQGSEGVAREEPVTGVAGTGQVGNNTAFIFYGLLISGNAATGAVGSVRAATARALSGNAATASRGTLGLTRDLTLTGGQVVVDVGSLAKARQSALAGAQSLAEAGVVGGMMTLPSGYEAVFAPASGVAYVPAAGAPAVVPAIYNRVVVPPESSQAQSEAKTVAVVPALYNRAVVPPEPEDAVEAL